MRVPLAVLALLLVPATVSAQISVGVRAGTGGARITTVPGTVRPFSFRSGLTAGAFAEIPVSRSVSIRPEVLFAQRGHRVFESSVVGSDGNQIEDLVFESRVNVAEFPVLARVQSAAAGAFRVGLVAGPTVAFRLSEHTHIERFVNGERSPLPAQFGRYVSSTAAADLGIALGGDVAVGPLALDLRYTHGLTQANADGSLVSVQNQAVTAALSYRVGL